MPAKRASKPSVALLLVLAAVAGCGGGTEPTETQSSTTVTEAPPTSGEETTTTPATTTADPVPQPTLRIVVRGGASESGIERLTVTRGETVKVVVVSDVDDHVHVHGYDLMKDVGPGRRAVLSFPADIPGRFEIELEDRGRQIGELEVRP